MALIKCLPSNGDFSNLKILNSHTSGTGTSLSNINVGNMLLLTAYEANGWNPSLTTATGARIISSSYDSNVNSGAVLAIAESTNVSFNTNVTVTNPNVFEIGKESS